MKAIIIIIAAILMVSCYTPSTEYSLDEMQALVATEEAQSTDSVSPAGYHYTYICDGNNVYSYYPAFDAYGFIHYYLVKK